MRGIVSSDRANGQTGLLQIEDAEGRQVYAAVVVGLSKTFTPKGYKRLEVGTAPTDLTVPPGAEFAIIIPEGGDLRWRDDGHQPTASIGMPCRAGQELDYDGDPTQLWIVGTTAQTVANVTFYGP